MRIVIVGIKVVGIGIIGIGGGGGGGGRGGERGKAEGGKEGKGDTSDMVERETEDEVKNMVAAQALGITGDVLTEIGRKIGDPNNDRTVQHHG